MWHILRPAGLTHAPGSPCEEDWDPGGGCSADSRTEQVTVSSCKAVGRLSCRDRLLEDSRKAPAQRIRAVTALLCRGPTREGHPTCLYHGCHGAGQQREASVRPADRQTTCVTCTPVPEANTGIGGRQLPGDSGAKATSSQLRGPRRWLLLPSHQKPGWASCGGRLPCAGELHSPGGSPHPCGAGVAHE